MTFLSFPRLIIWPFASLCFKADEYFESKLFSPTPTFHFSMWNGTEAQISGGGRALWSHLVKLCLGAALKFCCFARGPVCLELGHPQGQSIPVLLFDLCQEIIFHSILLLLPSQYNQSGGPMGWAGLTIDPGPLFCSLKSSLSQGWVWKHRPSSEEMLC